jgi:hypothetical protein
MIFDGKRQAMVTEVRLERYGDILDYCFKHGGIRLADNGSYGGTPDILRYELRRRGEMKHPFPRLNLDIPPTGAVKKTAQFIDAPQRKG